MIHKRTPGLHAVLLLGMTVTAVPALMGDQPVVGARAPTEDSFILQHERLMSTASEIMVRTRLMPIPVGLSEANLTKSLPAVAVDDEVALEGFARNHWGGRAQDLRQALLRLRDVQPELEPILAREGAPTFLLAVILVESAVQPWAESPRQARGLWQFIPATARRYGLRVDHERDDRLDNSRATQAAARYLLELHRQFGSWPLALAAYNAGEQTVEKALAAAGGGADFATLSRRGLLPQETLEYVPAVLSAIDLFRNLSINTPHGAFEESVTTIPYLPVLGETGEGLNAGRVLSTQQGDSSEDVQ